MPFSSSPLGDLNPFSPPTLLMLAGAAGLYASARFAHDALSRGRVAITGLAGRAALAHWMPIVAVAGVAVSLGRSEIALGIVFGTSVTALSLTLGVTAYLVTPERLPASRRTWPLLLPGGLISVVAGFRGSLGLIHATFFAVLGVAVWLTWRSASDDQPTEESLSAADESKAATGPAPLSGTPLRALQWILSIGLAILGAKLILLGTIQTHDSSKLLRAGLLTTVALSPLLLLPLLSTASDMAQRGRVGDACAASVGIALLNLTVLLPGLIFLWHLRGAHFHGTAIQLLAGNPVPMPLLLWRIDALVLTVLGFFLIPVGLGRWTIGRAESTALIICYASYLAVTASAWVRP